MSARTWEDAGFKFTSGVHANGDWRSQYGTPASRPFFRKAAEPVRTQGKAKGVCPSCRMALPMTGSCSDCD